MSTADLRTLVHVDQFEDGGGGWRDVPKVPNVWAAIVLRHMGDRDVVRWRERWWRWKGSHWQEAADGEMSAEVRVALSRVECRASNSKGDDTRAVMLVVDRKAVAETLAALADLMRVPDEVKAFTWRDRQSDDADPADLVVCKNGFFNLRLRKLVPADRRFMATGCNELGFENPELPEWNRWLKSLWPDEASRDHFQEVIGYLISGDRNLQKIPAFIGPPRSGKSIALRIVQGMLGEELSLTLSTAAFGENFGLAGLVDRRLGVIADLRLGRQVDRGAFAERLLTFSGEDRASISRKYLGDWRGTPAAKICYAANSPLVIGDDSSALPNRTVPVVFKRSWLGEEDPSLFGRLSAETPGILLWAAHGLDRLRRRGRFELPPDAERTLAEMVGAASPIAEFVADQCSLGPEGRVETDELWRAWREWAEAAGERPGTKISFGRSLAAAFPEISNGRTKGPRGEQRSRSYVGIGFRWSTGSVSGRVHYIDAHLGHEK